MDERHHLCGVCQNPSSTHGSKGKEVYYGSQECQKQDWKQHKPTGFDWKTDQTLREMSKDLKAVDFEVYREIGEGNFSKSKHICKMP